MKKLSFLILLSLSIMSCEKLILGDDEINSPENNFELFWNDFDDHYGLFTARGWDWDSIYQVYRPQVTPQTTTNQLWTIFSEMIEYLDDSHTFIYDAANDNIYVSGDSLAEVAVEAFSFDLVKSQIENTVIINDKEGDHFFYGNIKNKDIGYVYLEGIEGSHSDRIDDIISDLQDYEAIILDIRNNGGGDDLDAQRIAGAFADSEFLAYTAQTRNGPNHNDFDAPTEFYTKPIGDEQFTKPVIILTDRYTVSAAEIFLLYMKPLGHVTQLGDFTSGDFSDGSMLRFLPNDWLYRYSTQLFLTPAGKNLDGTGHEPDIFSINTKADIDAGQDKVMERAIVYLFEEYGIE